MYTLKIEIHSEDRLELVFLDTKLHDWIASKRGVAPINPLPRRQLTVGPNLDEIVNSISPIMATTIDSIQVIDCVNGHNPLGDIGVTVVPAMPNLRNMILHNGLRTVLVELFTRIQNRLRLDLSIEQLRELEN